MRIAVATVKGGLDDFFNQHFGRTPTFTIVDVENGEIKNVRIISNPSASSPRGAGVQAAQFCINEGVEVVIAGQFGPNSAGVLQAAGIRMISAPATMTVREAVETFLRGELTQAVFSSEGGRSYGGGMGRGMGRGMGGRRGEGRGEW
ncbi:NifB/NifX family molybdenum-iron cluster-binding protein [Thermococcus sp.]|uniref:NifB/NifX family molybdenum-iron cluster-binding protein n=1 Tax=Thermococcus sp. TaxID=35749 RepID=UPI0019C1A15E|nr:NifB/NifX family molybdenum-iron cluster-binding protein [Thermococcus sp.]MBC7094318.1 NifB/NifX family molybdenum-iron cluster-binding protein [Thermococcus sp.]